MSEHTSASLTWLGGHRFDARSGSGHAVITESVARTGHEAPSPMEMLLVAVGGCTAIDVVAILEKMREPLEALAVEVVGARADRHPKYFTAIEITYKAKGAGLSRERVERAVELSHTTYCSAVASLRPDCAVTSRVEIAET
jgi:putative redox protein